MQLWAALVHLRMPSVQTEVLSTLLSQSLSRQMEIEVVVFGGSAQRGRVRYGVCVCGHFVACHERAREAIYADVLDPRTWSENRRIIQMIDCLASCKADHAGTAWHCIGVSTVHTHFTLLMRPWTHNPLCSKAAPARCSKSAPYTLRDPFQQNDSSMPKRIEHI